MRAYPLYVHGSGKLLICLCKAGQTFQGAVGRTAFTCTLGKREDRRCQTPPVTAYLPENNGEFAAKGESQDSPPPPPPHNTHEMVVRFGPHECLRPALCP